MRHAVMGAIGGVAYGMLCVLCGMVYRPLMLAMFWLAYPAIRTVDVLQDVLQMNRDYYLSGVAMLVVALAAEGAILSVMWFFVRHRLRK